MKVLRRVFLAVCVLTVCLVFCPVVSNATPNNPKVILKMATNAPKGVGIELFIRNQITPAIHKVTNNDVKLDWYHGGIMGDNRDWLGKMKIDQLQGAGLDGSGVHLACPAVYTMQLPFMFNDFDEVAYIKKKMKPLFYDTFKKNGYQLLILLDQGFDTIYSTDKAIKTVEDFTNIRFATYCGRVEQEFLKVLKSSPIPLAVPEVAASMRSGVVNGLVCPSLWYLGAQLYTLGGSATVSTIRYTPAAIIVTQKAWAKISEKHQKAIVKVTSDLELPMDKDMKRSNDKSHRAMINYGGMTEIKMDSKITEALKEKTRPLWYKLAEKKVYPKEVLDSMIKNLAEYRLMKKTKKM